MSIYEIKESLDAAKKNYDEAYKKYSYNEGKIWESKCERNNTYDKLQKLMTIVSMLKETNIPNSITQGNKCLQKVDDSLHFSICSERAPLPYLTNAVRIVPTDSDESGGHIKYAIECYEKEISITTAKIEGINKEIRDLETELAKSRRQMIIEADRISKLNRDLIKSIGNII